jgi:hypothetical protein
VRLPATIRSIGEVLVRSPPSNRCVAHRRKGDRSPVPACGASQKVRYVEMSAAWADHHYQAVACTTSECFGKEAGDP